MAKITVGDVVIEGTIEELREWAELNGVEFPAKSVAVCEEGPAEEPLKVGDYARLKKVKGALLGFSSGETVKVSGPATGRYKFEVEAVGSGMRGYTDVDNLKKLSDEEVAKVKAEIERKAESEKWAKIGRKPNEFKKGDAIQYKKAFTTVLDVSSDGVVIKQSNNVSHTITVKPEDLTLAFPAEARFDGE